VYVFYSIQPGGQFLLAQASVSYALIALSGPLPARFPSKVIGGSGATVIGVHCSAYGLMLSVILPPILITALLFLSIMGCHILMRT